jgi:hypothetical protein
MAAAIHSRTKASGIAAAYSTGEISPLRSRASAVRKLRAPGPCYSSNGAFISGKAVRKSEVVEQRAEGNDFRVVRYALQLSEPDCEEPGSDSMVEEKRVGMLPARSSARVTSGVETVTPPKTRALLLMMVGSAVGNMVS